MTDDTMSQKSANENQRKANNDNNLYQNHCNKSQQWINDEWVYIIWRLKDKWKGVGGILFLAIELIDWFSCQSVLPKTALQQTTSS